MLTAGAARALALALPEAVEQDHHGFPSYRVRGRIFATAPDAEHLNVMVDEAAVREAVAECPQWCAELRWGKRLAGVQVTLAGAEPGRVAELLADAHRRRHP